MPGQRRPDLAGQDGDTMSTTTVGTMNVLLIDDDRGFGALLQDYFATTGIRLFLAADSDSALRILGEERVAAVLVDANLGESSLDGYDLCLHLRDQLQITVPIIMITGSLEAAAQGRDAGANGWLTKPFFPEEIMALLESLPSDS